MSLHRTKLKNYLTERKIGPVWRWQGGIFKNKLRYMWALYTASPCWDCPIKDAKLISWSFSLLPSSSPLYPPFNFPTLLAFFKTLPLSNAHLNHHYNLIKSLWFFWGGLHPYFSLFWGLGSPSFCMIHLFLFIEKVWVTQWSQEWRSWFIWSTTGVKLDPTRSQLFCVPFIILFIIQSRIRFLLAIKFMEESGVVCGF